MNRIDTCFQNLSAQKKKAFVAYICAGDPDFPTMGKIVDALVEAGIDILELGVPFSDPMADGIVNQMAAQRALEAGATLPKVLRCVEEIRQRHPHLPIVLFTYLNPVYVYGYARFHQSAKNAGVDGVLFLDLTPEEEKQNEEFRLVEKTDKNTALQHIRLIAPTTSEERIKEIAEKAEGFLYYVSRAGVTGKQSSIASGIAEKITCIRKYTSLPIAIGFGISTPEQAHAIAQHADGIVVGSTIVERIAQGNSPAQLKEFITPIIKSINSG